MKARRRLYIISICVLLFVGAVASVVFLRKAAARKLRACCRKPMPCCTWTSARFATSPPLTNSSCPNSHRATTNLVRDTGFAFERDLDEAAMAVHRGATRGATRYSEILVGRYDQSKLAQYLRLHSRSVEIYRDVEIFSVPSRTALCA